MRYIKVAISEYDTYGKKELNSKLSKERFRQNK